jgi:transcriptional regulator with XRE-family HTH domain
MDSENTKTIHQGRNVKRIREMLGVKQETLASELGFNQQKISLLEQKETIEPDVLQQVADVLKVPVEAIKNFDEQSAINIISNTFSDFKDNAIASAMNYQCSFNPIDKIVELYERMLKLEKEKAEFLQRLLDEKK